MDADEPGGLEQRLDLRHRLLLGVEDTRSRRDAEKLPANGMKTPDERSLISGERRPQPPLLGPAATQVPAYPESARRPRSGAPTVDLSFSSGSISGSGRVKSTPTMP